MINPQLKERIQQQIIAEFQNLLTTVSQAPDLNPTVKNLYVTFPVLDSEIALIVVLASSPKPSNITAFET